MLDVTTHTILDYVLTIIVTLIASTGFWTFFQYQLQVRSKVDEQRSMQIELLKGLAHDRIAWLGIRYIQRGWITHDEYENLKKYLYEPYVTLGGNGSVQKIMADVDKLPITQNELYYESDSKGDQYNV